MARSLLSLVMMANAVLLCNSCILYETYGIYNCKQLQSMPLNTSRIGHTRIKELHLVGGVTGLVTSSSFQTFPNLNKLFIRLSNVSIAPGMFQHLQHLNDLSLGENKMSGNMDLSCFDGMPSLTRLSLNLNQISSVSPPKVVRPKLNALFLAGNLISGTFDLSTFDNYPNLYRLRISSNRIELFNMSSKGLPKLSELYMTDLLISGNFDLSIFDNYQNLDTLYMSNNKLTSVTMSTGKALRKLSQLALDHNSIASLDAAVFINCVNLKHLYLAWNGLDTLTSAPSFILPKLQTLQLDSNPLRNISRTMALFCVGLTTGLPASYTPLPGVCPHTENECTNGTHNCASLFTCVDTFGSFFCQCKLWRMRTFPLNHICSPSCDYGSSACSYSFGSATCHGSPGGIDYLCQCDKGYSGDGVTCIYGKDCIGPPVGFGVIANSRSSYHVGNTVRAFCSPISNPRYVTVTCGSNGKWSGQQCPSAPTQAPATMTTAQNQPTQNQPSSAHLPLTTTQAPAAMTTAQNQPSSVHRPLIDECASLPCQNGGTCTKLLNAFTCQCTAGYTGDKCQTGFTCATNPCPKVLQCVRFFESFRCVCRDNNLLWNGTHCTDIYIIDPTPKSFLAARRYCSAQGAKLINAADLPHAVASYRVAAQKLGPYYDGPNEQEDSCAVLNLGNPSIDNCGTARPTICTRNLSHVSRSCQEGKRCFLAVGSHKGVTQKQASEICKWTFSATLPPPLPSSLQQTACMTDLVQATFSFTAPTPFNLWSFSRTGSIAQAWPVSNGIVGTPQLFQASKPVSNITICQVEFKCPNVSIANGIFATSGDTYGAAANVTCKTGFILSGNRTVHCQQSATWGPILPTCQALCRPPSDIGNYTILNLHPYYNAGDKLRLLCHPGYFFKAGSVPRTCRVGTSTGPAVWIGNQTCTASRTNVVCPGNCTSGQQCLKTQTSYICGELRCSQTEVFVPSAEFFKVTNWQTQVVANNTCRVSEPSGVIPTDAPCVTELYRKMKNAGVFAGLDFTLLFHVAGGQGPQVNTNLGILLPNITALPVICQKAN